MFANYHLSGQIDSRKEQHKLKIIKTLFKYTIFLILCCILVLGYAFRVEPFLLLVKEYQIGKPDSSSFLRLLQVSDIQISQDYPESELTKIVTKINEQKPDIVVFTGDLFDIYSEYHPVEEVTEALAQIQAPYGKYAIWGNRDYGGGADREYRNILSDSQFVLLENESHTIDLDNGKTIVIAGLDDALLGNPDIKKTEESLTQNADYRILLLHEPDLTDNFSSDCADLALAGHSHGGQVKLPYLQIFTTSLAEKYINGFYKVNGIELYVNTGIGTSHIPARFMVPPKLAVFDIGL